MKQKFVKIKKLLPRKMQTKRAAYFGMAVLIIFSIFTYDIFFRSPKVRAATVGTSSSGTPSALTSQRNILISDKGVMVVIYNLGTIGVTGIGYSTSADNGTTWSSATQIDAAQTNDFSSVIDGKNNIYVAYVNSKSIFIRKLSYSNGSYSVGSSSTLEAGSSCTGPGGGTGTNLTNSSVSLAINSAGRMESLYVANSLSCGVAFLSISYGSKYSDDGVTWNTFSGSVPGANDGTIMGPSPASLVAYGRSIWAVANDPNSSKLFVDIDGGGVTWTPVVGLAGNINPNEGASIIVLGDSIGIFYSSSGAASGLLYQNYSIATGTLSSATTISSSTNDLGGRLSTDSQNLWAVYDQFVGTNSYNVVYKRFNGTSWDTSATAITTDNLNNQNITLPERMPNTANLPILWATGTASPYTFKASTISTIGSTTDSGNQNGVFTGSLTGSSGDIIVKCGVWFYNTVNIVSGMTIKVCASNGLTGGSLTIYASSVTVAGTIDGAGRGMPGGVNIIAFGGTGGTGPPGGATTAGSAGSAGTNTSGGSGAGAFGVSGGSAGTNAAGGAAGSTAATTNGGSGGAGSTTTAGATVSTLAGYLGAGTNNDTSTDESTAFGSGGGAGGDGGSGAGGGSGASLASATCAAGGNGGNGAAGGKGGKGGNGGAQVRIYASGNLTVSGSISVAGQSGVAGGSSSSGSAGGNGGTSANTC